LISSSVLACRHGGTLPPDNASAHRLIDAIDIGCGAGGDAAVDGRPVRTWAQALLGPVAAN